MGRSDPYIMPFYNENISLKGEVALLGFTNNNWIQHGDLYDLELGNWNINSSWKLNKKYDTIVCTRCAYFAKDPEDFIARCYDNLNDGGQIYIDWGLGDHWRFKNFKIGWVKDGEHEFAYQNDNFLWSTVWSDSFMEDEQYKLFEKRVEKFGYTDVKNSIYSEVPNILNTNTIKKYFSICYNLLALWEDYPQLYILLHGIKKK